MQLLLRYYFNYHSNGLLYKANDEVTTNESAMCRYKFPKC